MHRGLVITGNTEHFSEVTGLAVEDWIHKPKKSLAQSRKERKVKSSSYFGQEK